MREVIYTVHGIETKSYAKAMELAEGREIDVKLRLEEVREARPQVSPIRKAMMEQFGFVSPRFKDKVVLPN